MAGCDSQDENGGKDKGQQQSCLEPIPKETIEAIFNMLYTPSGFAFDALELPLHPINAPGRNGGIRVVSSALLI